MVTFTRCTDLSVVPRMPTQMVDHVALSGGVEKWDWE